MKIRAQRFLPAVLAVAFTPLGYSAPLSNSEGLDIGTLNTLATGSKSGAVGNNNQVSGVSFAAGDSNNASYRSAAFGLGNVSYDGALTTGYGNVARYSSLAGGNNLFLDPDTRFTIAFGELHSVRHGYATTVFGSTNGINIMPWDEESSYTGGSENYSMISGGANAILQGTAHTGRSNIVLGEYNLIDTTSGGSTQVAASVLLGSGNTTSQTEAWALGKGNIAQTHTVTLGTYNATVSDASLIVGKGTSSGARSNALVVLNNGNVVIPNGSLTIGSEAALTPTSVGTYLSSHKYLTRAYGSGSSLNISSLLAIGEGAESNGDDSVAIGAGAYSNGTSSIALGEGSSSTGDFSHSLGAGARAFGDYSTSIGGYESTATGAFSVASGYKTKSTAAYSVVLGTSNLSASGTALVPLDFTGWSDNEVLFELGNGEPDYSPAQYSNAITTLKNGRTTLANKFWNSSTPTVIPSSTDASDGQALVVEGHAEVKGNTVLDGKVIIKEAQGDISMGIYE